MGAHELVEAGWSCDDQINGSDESIREVCWDEG
jgi:hypothetical protein